MGVLLGCCSNNQLNDKISRNVKEFGLAIETVIDTHGDRGSNSSKQVDIKASRENNIGNEDRSNERGLIQTQTNQPPKENTEDIKKKKEDDEALKNQILTQMKNEKDILDSRESDKTKTEREVKKPKSTNPITDKLNDTVALNQGELNLGQVTNNAQPSGFENNSTSTTTVKRESGENSTTQEKSLKENFTFGLGDIKNFASAKIVEVKESITSHVSSAKESVTEKITKSVTDLKTGLADVHDSTTMKLQSAVETATSETEKLKENSHSFVTETSSKVVEKVIEGKSEIEEKVISAKTSVENHVNESKHNLEASINSAKIEVQAKAESTKNNIEKEIAKTTNQLKTEFDSAIVKATNDFNEIKDNVNTKVNSEVEKKLNSATIDAKEHLLAAKDDIVIKTAEVQEKFKEGEKELSNKVESAKIKAEEEAKTVNETVEESVKNIKVKAESIVTEVSKEVVDLQIETSKKNDLPSQVTELKEQANAKVNTALSELELFEREHKNRMEAEINKAKRLMEEKVAKIAEVKRVIDENIEKWKKRTLIKYPSKAEISGISSHTKDLRINLKLFDLIKSFQVRYKVKYANTPHSPPPKRSVDIARKSSVLNSANLPVEEEQS